MPRSFMLMVASPRESCLSDSSSWVIPAVMASKIGLLMCRTPGISGSGLSDCSCVVRKSTMFFKPYVCARVSLPGHIPEHAASYEPAGSDVPVVCGGKPAKVPCVEKSFQWNAFDFFHSATTSLMIDTFQYSIWGRQRSIRMDEEAFVTSRQSVIYCLYT